MHLFLCLQCWNHSCAATCKLTGSIDDHPEQVSCHITYTNERTHEIIKGGLDHSPMYSGVIEGVGPRYCPSIEDKVVRFADKDSHQIFIEPEGLNSFEIYPNGISTSLPFDVQFELVRSIKGFENAFITRPGYAIEYDFFDPRDLKASLETKFIKGLFFAGQINGTTGYEEAAAQGMLAAINAALQVQGKEAWSPRRDQAYIGVLADDLITNGTQEPYRMFTSRAEYRLILREDNADLRLSETAHELGLLTEAQWQLFAEKREAIEREQQRLTDMWIQPKSAAAKSLESVLAKPMSKESRALDLLKRPEMTYEKLTQTAEIGPPVDDLLVAEQIEVQVKYEGYLNRQQEEINKARRYEDKKIPDEIAYDQVKGLSNEARQKLTDHRPETLGQAGRISGITPAAISLLLVHLKR